MIYITSIERRRRLSSVPIGIKFVKDMRVGELKKTLVMSKLFGNNVDRRDLNFQGKVLSAPVNMVPLVKDEFVGELVVGKGEKYFHALFVNKPNSFIKFRYTRRKTGQEASEIKQSLKELVEKVQSNLDYELKGKKNLSKDMFVRLYCGDQLVCTLGNRRKHDYEIPTRNQGRSFDYFAPRKEIWSVIIEDFHPGKTLEDYNIRDGSGLTLRMSSTRRFVDLELMGTYNAGKIHEYPEEVCNGINVRMYCPSCMNETNLIPFSHDSITSDPKFHEINNRKEIIWKGESFDFDKDDVFIGKEESVRFCAECDGHQKFLPKEIVFKNCYWKFSAIVVDPKVEKIRYNRIESKWERTWTKKFDHTEFSRKHEVVRFQVQVRFYDGSGSGMMHPDQNYCLFCRGLFSSDHGGFSTPLCQHHFHRSCVKKYYKNSETVRCIKCNPGKLNVLWVPDFDSKEKSDFVIRSIMDPDDDEETEGISRGCELLRFVLGGLELGNIPKVFLEEFHQKKL